MINPKIFYGWYVVLGLGVVGMVSTGMGGVNLGLYIPPMSESQGIPHSYFGLAFAARLIGFSITSWYLGILLDRYGARIPLAFTGFMAGLVMIGLSYLQSGWQLVLLYFILGAVGLEGGGGNLYQVVPISRWFIKKRGKAMSITVMGTTLGVCIFSPLTELVISTVGWRMAWRLLGGSCSLILILVALFVVRKDPESMGLQPDGTVKPEPISQTPSSTAPAAQEYSWTRKKAVRTYAFWALVLVHGLRTFANSTVQVFRIPHFIEQGISPGIVAWAVSVEAIVAAVFSLIAGRLADRMPPRFVVAGSIFLLIMMMLLTMNVTAPWHVFLATAFYGASAASYVVASNTLWPYLFGSEHIGSIRGIGMILTIAFGALGAPVCGIIKDTTGSYFPAWIISIVILSIVIVVVVSIQNLNPPDDFPTGGRRPTEDG